MNTQVQQSEDLRVILVGQTGLDAGLRTDPLLELIRARTPVDALGELADPLDPNRPGRAVVIVDPRIEPKAEPGPGDLTEFLEGLRRVNPDVRVLRVARNGESLPKGYDGQVGPGVDGGRLRETLGGPAVAHISGNGRHDPPPLRESPLGDESPASAQPESVELKPLSPPPGLPTEVSVPQGETSLVRRCTQGEPILDAALDAMRTRYGAEDLEFVEPGAESSVDHAHAAAPVHVADEVVGLLCSARLSPRALVPAAEWLGAWLGLEREHARLRDLAFRDPLTGAWNRRYFDEFLPAAIEEARTHRRALTLLLFDIDDFKRFNDQHGHGAGDEILTECVRLIDSAVRPTDKVCRIGGDEFAVVFYEPEGPRKPDSHHPTSVFDIAERFRALVREARFRKLNDDAPGHLTISGGLATYPWDGATTEALVERADQLALEGKKQGKNVIAIGPGCRRLEG